MRRIHIPSKTSDEGDEFVQIGGAGVTQTRAENDGHKPKDVLLPFDARIRLAAVFEDTGLHYTDSREELQRH